VKKALKIIAVSHVDEVIGQALVRAPEPIVWVEPEEAPVAPAEAESAVRPH
jgi:ATP-dependent Lon protease